MTSITTHNTHDHDHDQVAANERTPLLHDREQAEGRERSQTRDRTGRNKQKRNSKHPHGRRKQTRKKSFAAAGYDGDGDEDEDGGSDCVGDAEFTESIPCSCACACARHTRTSPVTRHPQSHSQSPPSELPWVSVWIWLTRWLWPRTLMAAFSNPRPTLVLENSGSVARDHLASERTFLAYVRTSLAIASMGVAVVQLFSMQPPSSPADYLSPDLKARLRTRTAFVKPLGMLMTALGILVLFVGLLRYFTIQSLLTKGQFPVARGVIILISLMLGVLVGVVFVVFLLVRR